MTGGGGVASNQIRFRLSPGVLAALDAYADDLGLSRHDAATFLLAQALRDGGYTRPRRAPDRIRREEEEGA